MSVEVRIGGRNHRGGVKRFGIQQLPGGEWCVIDRESNGQAVEGHVYGVKIRAIGEAGRLNRQAERAAAAGAGPCDHAEQRVQLAYRGGRDCREYWCRRCGDLVRRVWLVEAPAPVE